MGSNVGDRETHLANAIRALACQLVDVDVSSPYHSRAFPTADQPRFLNAAMVARSLLEAETLLGVAKGLEWLAGRRPGPRNSPRPLDIDVLVFGDRCIQRPDLVVPHPRLRERRFVLAPLAEIAPDLMIPPDEVTVEELFRALPADQEVKKSTWTLELAQQFLIP